MTQYSKISKKYCDGSKMEHPQRKYMIYPSWLDVCGDIHNLKVLDVGCGGGDSSRLLAKRGAKVVGIDKEMKNLRFALLKEQEHPMEIEYRGAEAEYLSLFLNGKIFDLITPTYLLHYAKTKEDLNKMISGISQLLIPGGRLVAILTDPENPVMEYFTGACADVAWIKKPWEEGSEIKVTYRGNHGEKVLSFRKIYWWKKETYEYLLVKSGFTNIQWIKPKMNKIGRELFPTKWKELENYPITILSAKKDLTT